MLFYFYKFKCDGITFYIKTTLKGMKFVIYYLSNFSFLNVYENKLFERFSIIKINNQPLLLWRLFTICHHLYFSIA